MPNGFHGSRDEWERISSPLNEIDPVWEDFSRARSLERAKNDRNWPSRTMKWRNEIDRVIQLYLADEKAMTFSFEVHAFEDRAGKRYWRRKSLKECVPWAEIRGQIRELLEEGYRLVESWKRADLKYAGDVAQP
jgi:hypothetical protein